MAGPGPADSGSNPLRAISRSDMLSSPRRPRFYFYFPFPHPSRPESASQGPHSRGRSRPERCPRVSALASRASPSARNLDMPLPAALGAGRGGIPDQWYCRGSILHASWGLSAGLSTERSQKGLIYFSQFIPSLKGFLAQFFVNRCRYMLGEKYS